MSLSSAQPKEPSHVQLNSNFPPGPRVVRPTGITVLAVIVALNGVLGLFIGFTLLQADPLTGFLFMVYSGAAFIAAYGLWEMLPWSWGLTIIFFGIDLLISFASLLVFYIVKDVVIIWYLASRREEFYYNAELRSRLGSDSDYHYGSSTNSQAAGSQGMNFRQPAASPDMKYCPVCKTDRAGAFCMVCGGKLERVEALEPEEKAEVRVDETKGKIICSCGEKYPVSTMHEKCLYCGAMLK